MYVDVCRSWVGDPCDLRGGTLHGEGFCRDEHPPENHRQLSQLVQKGDNRQDKSGLKFFRNLDADLLPVGKSSPVQISRLKGHFEDRKFPTQKNG